MACDNAVLKAKIGKMEDEIRTMQRQIELNSLDSLKTALQSSLTPCYKLHHYYKPSDYNTGDYEPEEYYYLSPQSACGGYTTIVYIPESELQRIADKIRS